MCGRARGQPSSNAAAAAAARQCPGPQLKNAASLVALQLGQRVVHGVRPGVRVAAYRRRLRQVHARAVLLALSLALLAVGRVPRLVGGVLRLRELWGVMGRVQAGNPRCQGHTCCVGDRIAGEALSLRLVVGSTLVPPRGAPTNEGR